MDYKYFISLGYFCSVASELEKCGLRVASGPFDWCISSFKGVIDCIENRFSGYLDYSEMLQSKQTLSHYKNKKYDISFFHDFNEFESLEKQLPQVQEKYMRRIDRFYDMISSPTLFVRYIKADSAADELDYIEKNYETIMRVLKSYNALNEIMFIGNSGVYSDVVKIYNVQRDEGDVVARCFLDTDPSLHRLFYSFDFDTRDSNIQRYQEKTKNKNRFIVRLRTSIKKKVLKLKRKYIHSSQY